MFLTNLSNAFIYNKKTSAPFENQPLILLDGLPIFNTNNIVNYDPRKVEKIEIIQRKYFLGNQIYSGVVQFFTYRRNLTDFKISESALVYDYEGLQNFREFYTPANTSTLKPHFPDFRNLLYWNSNIDIESGQQSEIDFITSMQSGKYALVINGISSEGRTCYGVKTFEVKKMKVN